MNGGKLALLIVTMMALGVLVLPNTVTLFAGQHYWYNLSGTGNQVPCQKCHADVFEELNNSEFHTHWGTSGVGDQYDCEACHRSNSSITYAAVNGSYTQYTPGQEAHAASVVACMLCHQYNVNIPGFGGDVPQSIPAGTFNLSEWIDSGQISTPFNYTNSTNYGHLEAHNAFVARAIADSTLQDSNEACIACHTFVAVKINWTHARSLEFDVGLGDNITTDYGPHNWTFTNWDYNRTLTARATVWGDTYGTNASTSYDSNVWPGTVPGVSYVWE